MGEYIQLFTTTESKDDAEMISREVVAKRLAACAQVLGPITSTYWWKDEIEKAEEWLCIMKSRRDLFNELEETIKGIHPYEVPEIVAAPIILGSLSYLEWLGQETKPG
jgi:periplasmic divalent cation tolerance protein